MVRSKLGLSLKVRSTTVDLELEKRLPILHLLKEKKELTIEEHCFPQWGSKQKEITIKRTVNDRKSKKTEKEQNMCRCSIVVNITENSKFVLKR